MMLLRLLRPVYVVYVIATFLCCLLLAFPIFLAFGSIDKGWARRVIWTVVHYWSRGWLFCMGMPVMKSGPRPEKNARFVYVANHISYLDTVLIYAAVPQYFRTLAKKEMAAIPVFGFVYKQLAILVDRSSAHSRAKSLRLMWRMLKRECNIAIFPEGTFNETDKPLKEFYDGAFRLAINTQTPVLPMIFPDTVSRWHYSHWWMLGPGRNRVIYLPTVPVAGMTLTDLPTLKQQVYNLMENAMIEANKN